MVNRWGNSGNSERLYFVGAPKSLQMVTAAMELRCLLLGRNAMTNLDNIFKSRHYFAKESLSGQSYVFSSSPVWMWELNYKAEGWRIDAFELWCWRRLLRVPWTIRRSNHSVLKEISPEYSLEDLCWSWNCNTLATWCEELTHWKILWCWEILKARGEGGNRGRDGWMALPTQWIWVWANSKR